METKLKPVTDHVEKAIKLTHDYDSSVLNGKDYIREMMNLEHEVTELYMQAGDNGFAPLECKDISERFQSLMAIAHNVILPFSENGLKTWEESNRTYLVHRAIEFYQKSTTRLEFE